MAISQSMKANSSIIKLEIAPIAEHKNKVNDDELARALSGLSVYLERNRDLLNSPKDDREKIFKQKEQQLKLIIQHSPTMVTAAETLDDILNQLATNSPIEKLTSPSQMEMVDVGLPAS